MPYIKSPDDVFTHVIALAMKRSHQVFGCNPLLIGVFPTALIWMFAITAQLVATVTTNPSFLLLLAFNISIVLNITRDNWEFVKDGMREWNYSLYSKYYMISANRKIKAVHIRLVLLTMCAICPTTLAISTDEIIRNGALVCLSVVAPLFALLWFAYAEASEPPIPEDGHRHAKEVHC